MELSHSEFRLVVEPAHGEFQIIAEMHDSGKTCSYRLSALSCSAMKDNLLRLAHLLTTIAKLLGPGGARAIVADSLLTKQQLLIINRTRRRSPKLTALDRFLISLCSLLVDGVSLICMFNKAISTKRTPQRLSSDNGPLLRYHQWQANLRILDI